MSTMVVLTFSGVPSEGGRVIGGRTCWILDVTNESLTRDVRRELLPTDSSPQMHIRTVDMCEKTDLQFGTISLTCRQDPSFSLHSCRGKHQATATADQGWPADPAPRLGKPYFDVDDTQTFSFVKTDRMVSQPFE